MKFSGKIKQFSYCELKASGCTDYEIFNYISLKMHDAYEASPILEKLPLKIESIACYGKSFGFSRPKLLLILVSVCIITSRLSLLVPNFCSTHT